MVEAEKAAQSISSLMEVLPERRSPMPSDRIAREWQDYKEANFHTATSPSILDEAEAPAVAPVAEKKE